MIVLMILVGVGTIMLMRFAPGYFADAREMDAKSGQSARSELFAQEMQQGTLQMTVSRILAGWARGDLGESRQYHIPVLELVRPRLVTTAWLLLRGMLYGWFLALCFALPLSATGDGVSLMSAPFTLLLAVPVGTMATLCLMNNVGGSVFVLTLVLAARDFKFLLRLLRVGWSASHLLFARSQGLRKSQLVRAHVIPSVMPQMLALASLSLVTALSALVPVEVLFDVPGIGQLAWAAAMNRDLPVLIVITLLMAVIVGFTTIFSEHARAVEVT